MSPIRNWRAYTPPVVVESRLTTPMAIMILAEMEENARKCPICGCESREEHFDQLRAARRVEIKRWISRELALNGIEEESKG